MQKPRLQMEQVNTREWQGQDGTEATLFLLLNRELSKVWPSLEDHTKSHNHFCCRRMVINKPPPVLAQIVFFWSSHKTVLPFEGSTGIDPDQNINYSIQISKGSYLFLVILNHQKKLSKQGWKICYANFTVSKAAYESLHHKYWCWLIALISLTNKSYCNV